MNLCRHVLVGWLGCLVLVGGLVRAEQDRAWSDAASLARPFAVVELFTSEG